jgi:hypothetical protein
MKHCNVCGANCVNEICENHTRQGTPPYIHYMTEARKIMSNKNIPNEPMIIHNYFNGETINQLEAEDALRFLVEFVYLYGDSEMLSMNISDFDRMEREDIMSLIEDFMEYDDYIPSSICASAVTLYFSDIILNIYNIVRDKEKLKELINLKGSEPIYSISNLTE